MDDYYEEKKKEKEKKRKKKRRKYLSRTVALVFAIIFSIVLGIVVYRVVDGMVGPNNIAEEEFLGESLSLTDENVQILYDYVTSGIGGSRITKFATEDNVTVDSFSNREKIEYALQFAQLEDFEFIGEYNEKKQKIYSFSDRTLQNYITIYFGPNVTFESEPQLTYPFLFYINQMNEGVFTYNQSSAGYDVTFPSRYDFEEHKNTIDSVYGQLISALQKPDGSVVLQERVVYTELRTDNGGYVVDIYKDYQKTEKLDTKSGLTDDSLNEFQINISDYPSTAIIEYTFGLNIQTLYFKSSRIIL